VPKIKAAASVAAKRGQIAMRRAMSNSFSNRKFATAWPW
jgi:hypothetical protein